MPETIWMYESPEPTSYHDQSCRCARHCGNCWADLDGHDGTGARPARARYCSDYCKGSAARARAFDRFMESQPSQPVPSVTR